MSRPIEEVSSGWGERICCARKSLRWTQADLAKHLGVVKATVGRWELEQHPVSQSVWPTLADTLGVPLDWLRDGKGPMSFPPLISSIHVLKMSWLNRKLALKNKVTAAQSLKNNELRLEASKQLEDFTSEFFTWMKEIDKVLNWVSNQNDRNELEQLEYSELLHAHLARVVLSTNNTTDSIKSRDEQHYKNITAIPVLTRACELIEPFASALGITLSEESKSKIAIVAASIAIRAKRDDPTREDVLNALGEMSEYLDRK